MAQPSPLLALSTANWVLAATEARLFGKIRLNTNGWERGEVLDGFVCLRSCRLTGGFGPGGGGPDDFKKEGRCSDERKHVAQR